MKTSERQPLGQDLAQDSQQRGEWFKTRAKGSAGQVPQLERTDCRVRAKQALSKLRTTG